MQSLCQRFMEDENRRFGDHVATKRLNCGNFENDVSALPHEISRATLLVDQNLAVAFSQIEMNRSSVWFALYLKVDASASPYDRGNIGRGVGLLSY